MKLLYKLPSCLILLSYALFTQEIPTETFIYNKNELLFDFGKNWENNSVFGSYRLKNIYNKDDYKKNNHSIDSIMFSYSAGFIINQKSDIELNSFLLLRHKHYFSYLYPRIVNNADGFERYTGIPRNKSRYGFQSGETDLSGIGYKNNNVLFQVGRGRESWGAGKNIQISLSNASSAYDYFKFMYDENKIRFIYFHGFLENINEHNRYITGKGLEFTNKESVLIGLSEIIIYSGLNRPIDLAYLNPISNHLEIELNDRQNVLGLDHANAIWQLSSDIFFKNGYRISANFIIDEITIDKIESDSGKVNGLGFSTRISRSTKFKEYLVSLYGGFTSIGTHTYRHANGYNNFIQRGTKLAWQHGSDGYEFKFGCNIFNNVNFIVNTNFGKRVLGSSNISNNQYSEYTDGYKNDIFPSGNLDTTYFLNAQFQWQLNYKNNILVNFNYQNNDNNISGITTSVNFSREII